MMMCFVVEILCSFPIQRLHIILITFPCCLQYVFDLCNCNYREVFREEEVTSKEQTEGSNIETYLPNGRPVVNRPG